MTTPRRFQIKATRVSADGTETEIGRKTAEQPALWADPSDQATRDEALRKRITGSADDAPKN